MGRGKPGGGDCLVEGQPAEFSSPKFLPIVAFLFYKGQEKSYQSKAEYNFHKNSMIEFYLEVLCLFKNDFAYRMVRKIIIDLTANHVRNI